MKKVLLSKMFIPVLTLLLVSSFSYADNVKSVFLGKQLAFKSDVGIKAIPTINYLSNDAASALSTQKTSAPNINNADEHVPLGEALPLLVLAILLFGFGANRRRV